jgi:hypothetical protein
MLCVQSIDRPPLPTPASSPQDDALDGSVVWGLFSRLPHATHLRPMVEFLCGDHASGTDRLNVRQLALALFSAEALFPLTSGAPAATVAALRAYLEEPTSSEAVVQLCRVAPLLRSTLANFARSDQVSTITRIQPWGTHGVVCMQAVPEYVTVALRGVLDRCESVLDDLCRIVPPQSPFVESDPMAGERRVGRCCPPPLS